MNTKLTSVELLKVAAGWVAAVLSIAAFVWDGLTPGSFPGTLAIGLAVFAAAIYLGARTARTVQASTAELAKCIDGTIGVSIQFGRDAERRRWESRAPLASVSPLVPRGKGSTS